MLHQLSEYTSLFFIDTVPQYKNLLPIERSIAKNLPWIFGHMTFF